MATRFPIGAFVNDLAHDLAVWEESETRASLAGSRNPNGAIPGEVLSVARDAGDAAVYLGLFSILGNGESVQATFIAKITPEHALRLGRKLVDLANT